ncbi:MAG: PilT protein-like protein [Segetibacter sp.]|jgi:PIN domain nuclease of toxin-antitoxin system|nr:PilT protein-like protein [Segetibacter sp.]
MANYLLDTHALLWMQVDSELISSDLRKTLLSEDSRLHLSIASLWEIVIKQQINKLKLDFSLSEIASYCIENNIVILPVSLPYIIHYSSLPLLHTDPFDRMIVATSLCDGFTLISKDTQLSAYKISVIW